MFISPIGYQNKTQNHKPSFKSIHSRVMLNPKNVHNRVLVNCDVKKLDNLLSENHFSYIPRNGKKGIEKKYNSVRQYIFSGKKIHAPILDFYEENGKIIPEIYDGRHRFAVIRDMGISEFPMAIEKKAVELAKSLGLVL